MASRINTPSSRRTRRTSGPGGCKNEFDDDYEHEHEGKKGMSVSAAELAGVGHGHGTHAHGHPHLAHHFDSMETQHNAAKLGMWLFLATEILLFAGLFVAYSIFRAL